MKADLNLLTVFAEIYRERNLTKAAKSLGMTQSAVSQALSRLRLHFDDKLFFRISAGMAPTDKAHAIAPHIAAALSSAESAFLTGETFDPKITKKIFKIGMIDLDAVLIGPKLVNHLKEKAPHIRIDIVPTEPEDCLASLDRGDISISVNCVDEILPKRFTSDVLFHDKIVIISSSTNRHIRKNLTLKKFLNLTHLSVPLGDLEQKYIDPIFSQNGMERKIGLTVSHMLAAPMIVRQTDLIAPVYLSLMNYCSDIEGLEIHEFPIGDPLSPISLIWHERVSGNIAYKWIIEEITEIYKYLVIAQ